MRIAALLVSLALSIPLIASPLDDLTAWLAHPRDRRPELSEQPFATAALTRTEADQARGKLWADHVEMVKAERKAEWEAKAIAVGDHTLRLKTKFVGSKPAGGWNLFISMHGGGQASTAVNDGQWENQIKLYSPKDSLYVAPRAPTNTWNLWHEAHIDVLFNRLIEDAIVLEGVNPDRVYIMGYSAGGDGVYQLAPRMADHWAAASMMAGHPNDASPLGLRDIGFTIHVGALDDGYHRNDVAREWGKKLDDLQKADPDGYQHLVKLHEGRSHWMNREDAEAVDWMLKFTRDPMPKKVVWYQSPVTHDRFYWLAEPADQAKAKQTVVATRDGQAVEIEKAEGVHALTIRLNDDMADLDSPVTVTSKGKTLFTGRVNRTIATMWRTLDGRGDPRLVFDAEQTVELGK